MKAAIDSENLSEAIKGADLSAQRKAFRKHMPYAILKDGKVILVYPDKHTEIVTPELLEDLNFS
jgi:hypothetical protein